MSLELVPPLFGDTKHREVDKARSPKPPTPQEGFACPDWSPQLTLPSHGACDKASLVPRNLGMCYWERNLFLGISRNYSFPQSGTDHTNKSLFPETFGIILGIFPKRSQEQFPGIVPHELWCRNLGKVIRKGLLLFLRFPS